MDILVNAALFIGGIAVAAHTLLMANFTTACPWYFKPVLILCVPGGILMAWGGVYNPGIGMYAAAVTVLPLIAVQIMAWHTGAEVSEHLRQKAAQREAERVQNYMRFKNEVVGISEDYRDILTESGKREVERIK
jgi:hypothetical protein